MINGIAGGFRFSPYDSPSFPPGSTNGAFQPPRRSPAIWWSLDRVFGSMVQDFDDDFRLHGIFQWDSNSLDFL